ncbi:MAG: aspartate-semialdehyde dehydrogenase [Pseudanabaenaceae cyanobacterium bins.68]|nr:aspartate-semialdehyde dehydrogenase [Pseudanabaenaceae cyanobacterium bins.68]
MTKTYNLAILGATGAVGTELLKILEQRKFPINQLKLLASPNSVGKQIKFKDTLHLVEPVSASAFQGIDLVLASAGGTTSKEWASLAVAAGAVVIDNSSAFRMNDHVPLVVPEVNPQAAKSHQGIIANPNCTTILMSVVIYPLHQLNPIKRIVASTYQSASGAGARAMAELQTQAQAHLSGQPVVAEVFPYPLAFNLFLHNSPMQPNGYCQEELKMVQETRKIFSMPDLAITATCVRVPVLRAHSEAINLEFTAPVSLDQVNQSLAKAPGVKLLQDFTQNRFPMPIDVSGKDDVLVGRIRQDLSHPCAIDLWLCGDQIRKGAALNAIQIAELLITNQWLKP